MKTLMFALLFITGTLMAQENTTRTQHLSEFQRRALRSQSPAVPTSRRNKQNKKDADYRVTENKTTITATVPYGK